MSLIRSAVVAGVVIYAIPNDPQKQQELVQTASDTIVWSATYCQREPDTCREAGEFITAAMQKAKFGLSLAQQVASKWPQRHEPDTGPQPDQTLTIDDILAAPPAQPGSRAPAAQNTTDPSVSG